jgi:hypothetical protein
MREAGRERAEDQQAAEDQRGRLEGHGRAAYAEAATHLDDNGSSRSSWIAAARGEPTSVVDDRRAAEPALWDGAR